MILGADNRKAWSELDILVAQAYETYKAEKCSQCGRPYWLCHSSDARLNVRIKFDNCYATSELRKYEDAHKEDDESGGAAYVEFYSRDDTPLVDFRALFAESDIEDDDD